MITFGKKLVQGTLRRTLVVDALLIPSVAATTPHCCESAAEGYQP
jgi:hypothetical protein